MPTPAGSPASPLRIDLARHVGVEVGRSATAQISLGETASRNLAGVSSGTIKLSDLWNKSSIITIAIGFLTNTDSTFQNRGNNLDGLNFSTETTIDPAAQLGARRGHSGANSRTKGYAAGGYSGWEGWGAFGSQTVTSAVDGLVFATQTAFTTSATAGARGEYGATNSETRGFWAGGANYSRVVTSLVDGINFSTETTLSTSASIRARYIVQGVSSASRGYYAGGNNFGTGYGIDFNEIDGVIFSSLTSVDPSAALATTRAHTAGINSNTKGYWCGGGINDRSQAQSYSEIDGIDFASETSINPAVGLSVSRRAAAGLNSSTRGYVCGGYNQAPWLAASLREIDGILFSSETQINPSAALVIGKDRMASFQDYGNNP